MLSPMADAYIVDAVRSPIGRRNGSLSEIRADELAAQVLNGLVGRVDLDPGEVEDVQMGCVTQVGEQALNVGRGAVLVAGWPETVCATTVDRQCGSSLQTAFNSASAVQAGHLDLVVAAGVEHMTRVPMGSNLGDVGWGAVNEKIGERWPIVPQGISAEVIAEEWEQSREQLDGYSLESHRRAVAAIDGGKFENEIVPIEVGAGGAIVLFAVDETPRRDTSLEKLASLQPAFKPDGVVTAGNSSSSSTARPQCCLRAKQRSSGTDWSRARDSSRSDSPAWIRIACSTGIPRRARRRSRRRGSDGTTSR